MRPYPHTFLQIETEEMHILKILVCTTVLSGGDFKKGKQINGFPLSFIFLFELCTSIYNLIVQKKKMFLEGKLFQ